MNYTFWIDVGLNLAAAVCPLVTVMTLNHDLLMAGLKYVQGQVEERYVCACVQALYGTRSGVLQLGEGQFGQSAGRQEYQSRGQTC